MTRLLLKLILAPGLVGAASLAGRRWGHAIEGWLSSFPVIAGPVLYVLALEQGNGFAAEAARGTLAGVLALVLFCLAYAWTSRAAPWPVCLAAGWAAYGAGMATLAFLAPPFETAFAAVLVALLAAAWILPPSPGRTGADAPGWEIPARMLAAAALVLALTGTGSILGPMWSGLLATFPVAGTTLAVFTHRRHGPAGATAFFRGFVTGLQSFSAFALTLALILPTRGRDEAFVIATGAAVAMQAVSFFRSKGFRAAPAPGDSAS
ncbi:MAG: hypothetical protein V1809_02145 [Planctomycetota bacterium]